MSMQKMSLRSKVALAAAAAVLTPALSSCGFDYATDQLYTPAVGTNDRDGDVNVLNALIVSTEAGSGTFIATLASDDLDEEIVFESLGGDVTPERFRPVEIPRATTGVANLAEDGIKVTGDFQAGNFVTVNLSFDNGQAVELEVPVVANRGVYAGYDGPAPEPAEDDDDH